MMPSDDPNALSNAARDGDADGVRELVNEGADLEFRRDTQFKNQPYFNGLTPLMEAAGSPSSDSATVAVLLELGAQLDAKSAGGVTALWYAAGGGASVEFNDEGWTEWISFGGGDVERLRLLIDSGGDPNECAGNGRSALCCAAESGDAKRVALLLERGASPWPRELDRKARVAESYVRQGMKPSQVGAEIHQRETRLNWGPTRFEIPLFLAAESGNLACVHLILASGFPADYVDNKLTTALFHADTPEIAASLLAAGCPVDSKAMNGDDACDEALQNGRLDVAKFLIQSGAPIEAPGYGMHRFHRAAMMGDFEGCELLINLGVDVRTLSDGGRNVLHAAVWRGDSEDPETEENLKAGIRSLVEWGALVNSRDINRNAPLHIAVLGDWSSPTAVQALIDSGADVDVRNEDGLTPLHLAAGELDLECARLLLNANADRTIRDTDGRTPFDIANGKLKEADDDESGAVLLGLLEP